MTKQTFGEFIRSTRESMDPPLTLRAFAQRVGISATYLSKIERQEFSPPHHDVICRMADGLGLNKDMLLGKASKIHEEIIEIILQDPEARCKMLREKFCIHNKDKEGNSR